MDKPTATIDQITMITDQLITLMSTHLFVTEDVVYMAGVFRQLHTMCLDELGEPEK